MGIAAFVLSLIYRTYRLTTDEEVANDPEDTRVAKLTDEDSPPSTRTAPSPTRPATPTSLTNWTRSPAGGVAMSASEKRSGRA